MSSEGARYRFEMGRVIGEGSFGVVYRARMHLPGGIVKLVAIKVLHENLDAGTRATERMISEARILGTVSDPGIVAVNELTQLAGRQALVMEYVPGRDLRDCLLTDPPISARATLEVLAKVASTLHNAWSKPGTGGEPLHLVHRDIKPENIRVTEAGDVKLLDFGIAKPASARTWSSEQEALGTLLYMAPELFRGGEGTKQQTPARDVFGLGCILYEAASGVALFEGLEVADVMRLGMDRKRFDAHLDTKLALLQGFSGDLSALLRVMLAWDPKIRPDPIRVADVAYTLLDNMPGPRLFPWCRSVEWSEPVGTQGDLTGRVLESETSTSMLHATGSHASMAAPMVPELSPVPEPVAAAPAVPPPAPKPVAKAPTSAPLPRRSEPAAEVSATSAPPPPPKRGTRSSATVAPATTPDAATTGRRKSAPVTMPLAKEEGGESQAEATSKADSVPTTWSVDLPPSKRDSKPLLLAGAGLLVLGVGAMLLALALQPDAPPALAVAGSGSGSEEAGLVFADVPASHAWPSWMAMDCGLDAAFADLEPSAGGFRRLPSGGGLECVGSLEGVSPDRAMVAATPELLDAAVVLAVTETCPSEVVCPQNRVQSAGRRGGGGAAGGTEAGGTGGGGASGGGSAGTVRLTSAKACVAVEARGGGRKVSVRGSASVPAGSVEIFARFEGREWEKQASGTLKAGGQLTVECSCLSQLCSLR